MKKLSILLATILTMMLSLCLFSGCNTGSIEGKYVFYSETVYNILPYIESRTIIKGKDVQDYKLEEYKVGDTKDGEILTETYCVATLREDGSCDLVFGNDREIDGMRIIMCCHWEETTIEDSAGNSEDWIHIHRNQLSRKQGTFTCTPGGSDFDAYMDKGDLVIITERRIDVHEIRLKRVERDADTKARAQLAGIYGLSSLTATRNGVTKTINVGEPDEDGYAYKPLDVALVLWEDGVAVIEFSMLLSCGWGTWRLEDGKIVLTSDQPMPIFQESNELVFTLEGDTLIYTVVQEELSGNVSLKKLNIH